MDLPQIPNMTELTTPSEPSDIKKEVENASSSGTNTLMKTSNSTLSPQHQVLTVVNSPIILPLSSELDFQDVDSSDEETTNFTISDGACQPELFGPKPIVMVERLTEKCIQELTAGVWRCSSCGKEEKSYLMLDLHIDTGCEELSPIECDICPAVVREYRNFVAHFMEHKMGERRKCPICLQEPIPDLKQHLILEDHFSLNVSKLDLQGLAVSHNLSTSGCSISFESKREAKSLNDQNKCLKIRLQDKKHRKIAKKHINVVNAKKCSSESSSLKKHQTIHTDEKHIRCSICQKSFSRASLLNRHQRVHSGEKPFKCDICEKSFSRAYTLNLHQRLHTGEKPFKCDVCKKSYPRLCALSWHLRLHTGEKRFKCDVCDKDFWQMADLIRHQRVHSGEKPFKCDICEKSFSQAGSLTMHQRMHTGEKPFKCDICGKIFSRKRNLNTHQRVHTGGKLFKCDRDRLI